MGLFFASWLMAADRLAGCARHEAQGHVDANRPEARERTTGFRPKSAGARAFGFEQLLDQLVEEGADEAAKRYLIPNRVVAKGVQLRLLRQRVVMTAQKAQADVCAPTPPALRTTGVGRCGGETRRARRVPQRSPGKGVG
jgi:hypothetical protein